MELMTLIENTTFQKDLLAEHGLSFLIKIDNLKILFDTGSSGLFLENIKKLNEPIDNIDFVILSHGHYDHTGGLEKLLEYNKSIFGKSVEQIPVILLKKEALYFKYKKVKHEIIDKGFKIRKDLNRYPNKIIYIDKYYKLSDKAYVIGNIEKFNDFEGFNPGYYYYNDIDIDPKKRLNKKKDKDFINYKKMNSKNIDTQLILKNKLNDFNINKQYFNNININQNKATYDLYINLIKKAKKDYFKDELFLVLKDKKNESINIITGCSHNGIINIVKTAINFFKINKINLIAGGFHLKSKDTYHILKIINEFKKIDFNIIGTNHCTGFEAYRLLKNYYSNKIKYLSTGTKIVF